jgi:hypothetical protein
VVAGGRPRRVALERRLSGLIEQPREDGVDLTQVIERVRAQGCPSTPPGTPVFVE